MICLYLSSKSEAHLEELGEVYSDLTGQVFNPAEFVENFVLALTPDMLRECVGSEDD